MLDLLRKLFDRRSAPARGYERRRQSGLGRMFGGRRRTMLGTLASFLAPFVMRKLTARRSRRPVLGAR